MKRCSTGDHDFDSSLSYYCDKNVSLWEGIHLGKVLLDFELLFGWPIESINIFSLGNLASVFIFHVSASLYPFFTVHILLSLVQLSDTRVIKVNSGLSLDIKSTFQVAGQFDEFIENFKFFRWHPSVTVGKRCPDDFFLSRTDIDDSSPNILHKFFQFSETKLHNSSDSIVIRCCVSK